MTMFDIKTHKLDRRVGEVYDNVLKKLKFQTIY